MEGIWRILNGRVISKVAILCCMLPVFALSQCQPNTGQPLDFQPFGNFGLAGQRLWAFTFTPTGGTPPYQFSLASGATPLIIWNRAERDSNGNSVRHFDRSYGFARAKPSLTQ
jgi:hypothetical protein